VHREQKLWREALLENTTLKLCTLESYLSVPARSSSSSSSPLISDLDASVPQFQLLVSLKFVSQNATSVILLADMYSIWRELKGDYLREWLRERRESENDLENLYVQLYATAMDKSKCRPKQNAGEPRVIL